MQTILIVDDVEINRKILASFFEEQYNILEAADGEEAIRIINEKKKEISLIFLDLIMPNKNGIDVLIYLRGVGLLDCIPVIMITGEATEETDMKTYKYEAANVIYKPFTEKIVTKRAINLMEQFIGTRAEPGRTCPTGSIQIDFHQPQRKILSLGIGTQGSGGF